MKRCALKLLLLACASLAAAFAQAQTIRPGLWQVNNKMRSASAGTDQAVSALLGQVAALPPEQRKMVENMAASHGLSMPEVAPDGSISLNTCVTSEMAARRQIPLGQPGECKSDNVATPGGMNLAFTCANPASSGEGKLRFIGDTGFTMTMQITTSARGQPEQVRVDSTGKWLGAACPVR